MSSSAVLGSTDAIVIAGGSTTVPLDVRNEGEVVEEYRFKVVGLLAPWASVEPDELSLYPGDSSTVSVTFQLPRTGEVPAGPVPYAVRVRPTEHPGEAVVPEGTIVVEPFYETTAELVPGMSEGKRSGGHRVAVHNRGNAPLSVALRAKDARGGLSFGIEPSTFRVDAGTTRYADVTVRPAEPLWRGADVEHPFTIEVVPEEGAVLVLVGAYRQEARLAPWLFKVLKVFPALGRIFPPLFKSSFAFLKIVYALVILALVILVLLVGLFLYLRAEELDIPREWIPWAPPEVLQLLDNLEILR